MQINKGKVFLEAMAIVLVLGLLAGAIGISAANIMKSLRLGVVWDWQEIAREARSLLPGGDRPQPQTPASAPSVASGSAMPATGGEIKLDVTRVRFFAAGKDVPPLGERKYAAKFKGSAIRYMWVEVAYRNPFYRQHDAEIPLVIQYWGPDGNLAGEVKTMARPRKEWENALTTHSWRPASWQKGVYTVRLLVNGTAVGQGTFEVE